MAIEFSEAGSEPIVREPRIEIPEDSPLAQSAEEFDHKFNTTVYTDLTRDLTPFLYGISHARHSNAEAALEDMATQHRWAERDGSDEDITQRPALEMKTKIDVWFPDGGNVTKPLRVTLGMQPKDEVYRRFWELDVVSHRENYLNPLDASYNRARRAGIYTLNDLLQRYQIPIGLPDEEVKARLQQFSHGMHEEWAIACYTAAQAYKGMAEGTTQLYPYERAKERAARPWRGFGDDRKWIIKK